MVSKCRSLGPRAWTWLRKLNQFPCSGLEYLCFRQNLLRDASDLSNAAFKDTLQELHLNDNQISQVPVIQDLTALTKLELSYNHEVCFDQFPSSMQQWRQYVLTGLCVGLAHTSNSHISVEA